MKDKLAPILTVLTIIGMAFGVYFFLDATFAKCAEVKAIERRLDYKIESDTLNTLQERLWKMEDRYGPNPDKIPDPGVKQQMKELKTGVGTQRNKVDRMEGK